MTTDTREAREARAFWLSLLKADDEVWTGQYIVKIERVTPTQFVLPYGRRYRRDTGRIVGDFGPWNTPPPIEPVTPQIRESIHRRNLMLKIKRANIEAMDTDQLKRIAAVIEEQTIA